MDLSTPVSKLFMVGSTYARRLKKLNIETAEDLLYHFPFRYLDYSLVSPISRIQPGETVTIKGQIFSFKNEYTKNGKKIQKAVVVDQSGSIEAIWFNQPFLVRTLIPGLKINLSGKIDWFGRKKVLISPEYEILNKSGEQGDERVRGIHTGRLVPVYHETYGVSSKWLRSRIAPIIEKFTTEGEDFLPNYLLKKHQLLEITRAIKQIHFPNNFNDIEEARQRFAFEEMLLIHLRTFLRKKNWQKKKLSYPLVIDGEKTMEFIENLPFELTKAQKRVLKEIFADLKKNKPMNRLLEGDVGSGKTVVAAGAIYAASLNHVQSALMAPTEILAEQHYQTLNQFLNPLGVKIDLITGSKKPHLAMAEHGGGTRQKLRTDLLIGTHALIHKSANFDKLGLVIIDEQHRFGVEQRSQLIKKGSAPHILTMTATPIPRTIALTLYGDLDLSFIDEMPPGRQKVKTWVVPKQKREAAYNWIRSQVKITDSQAFIICPLIEESDSETLQTVKAATSEYKRLSEEIFKDLSLGLLHGRMKSREKNEILSKFKARKLDILVSTPVVEVGIDVPSATIMMVEGADRFGLAQLHQLRGRVGRGKKQSYCLLFAEIEGEKISRRLKALERTNIGMELAEIDLQLRGPGEIYGTSQHGFFNLKVASFSDHQLIEKTKKESQLIFNLSPTLKEYPHLQAKLKQVTIKTVEPN